MTDDERALLDQRIAFLSEVILNDETLERLARDADRMIALDDGRFVEYFPLDQLADLLLRLRRNWRAAQKEARLLKPGL